MLSQKYPIYFLVTWTPESFTCCTSYVTEVVVVIAHTSSFCMHLHFKSKDPIATPSCRRRSSGFGRLRRWRCGTIGWRRYGVGDDVFEGSFRAGKPVIVSGLNRTRVALVRSVPPRCLEGKLTLIRLKSNFYVDIFSYKMIH